MLENIPVVRDKTGAGRAMSVLLSRIGHPPLFFG